MYMADIKIILTQFIHYLCHRGKEEYVEKLDEDEIPQLYIPNSENKVFEGWYLDREFSKEYENKLLTQILFYTASGL